jgi:soluble lytic murein transglycosylase-like protein
VIAAAVLVIATVAFLAVVLSNERDVKLVPGAGTGSDHYDPLAFRDDSAASFERRAAAGVSHVLYAKSPGGATASARRTAAWRPEVEAVAARFRLDPDLLEAIVFLESAGRPDVVAGHHLESAAGLTQILAETAVNLLGMRVDLATSRRLTRRIEDAAARGNAAAVRRLRAARRRVDERFDPPKALAGTGRYLALARQRFGREDLAVVSYHMGIGNLETALRAYADEQDDPMKEVVDRDELSYARLFFDSTPLLHTAAYDQLAKLGDDSATYLWRVLAAREILRLDRENPAELARLESLHSRKASAEEVLHPPGSTEVFDEPDDIVGARRARRLVALPPSLATHFVRVDKRMGEFALRLGRRRAIYRALRPEALALLAYLGTGVEAISGDAPLIVTSAARDRAYQRLLTDSNGEATRGYSLHTTGYAFDVLRSYRSRKQALAFQFWLDRLQAMNMIAWARESNAIHVTVSDEAWRLVPVLLRRRPGA